MLAGRGNTVLTQASPRNPSPSPATGEGILRSCKHDRVTPSPSAFSHHAGTSPEAGRATPLLASLLPLPPPCASCCGTPRPRFSRLRSRSVLTPFRSLSAGASLTMLRLRHNRTTNLPPMPHSPYRVRSPPFGARLRLPLRLTTDGSGVLCSSGCADRSTAPLQSSAGHDSFLHFHVLGMRPSAVPSFAGYCADFRAATRLLHPRSLTHSYRRSLPSLCVLTPLRSSGCADLPLIDPSHPSG